MIWFLHGNLGRSSDWNDILNILSSQDIPTKALSLSGIFPSPVPPLCQSGEILKDYILHRDTEPVLCGYSLGGRLAMHAYISSPNSFAGLILIGAHPGLKTCEERDARFAMDSSWQEKLEHLTWEDFYREWTSQPVFQGSLNIPRSCPSSKELEFLREGFLSWSLGTQENLFSQLNETIAEENTPILLISGEKDLKFDSLYREWHSEYPYCKQTTIPHTGHRIIEDNPVVLAGHIANFYHSL